MDKKVKVCLYCCQNTNPSYLPPFFAHPRPAKAVAQTAWTSPAHAPQSCSRPSLRIQDPSKLLLLLNCQVWEQMVRMNEQGLFRGGNLGVFKEKV